MTGAAQVMLGAGGVGGAGGSLSATASPSSVSNSSTTSGSLITPATTCTASGGAGGYTYAWSRVSGDATTTSNTPTSASSTFSANVGAANPTRASVWKCTVTDALGASVDSNTVAVELDYTGP